MGQNPMDKTRWMGRNPNPQLKTVVDSVDIPLFIWFQQVSTCFKHAFGDAGFRWPIHSISIYCIGEVTESHLSGKAGKARPRCLNMG